MSPSEKSLQSSIRRMVLQEFPNVFFFKTHDEFTVGLPDIVLCVSGYFLAMELKVGANGPTRLQQEVIDAIIRSGGIAGVVRSVDGARKLIKGVIDAKT